MTDPHGPTVIDVVENALGVDTASVDVSAFSIEDFDQLADAVNDFYASWEPITADRSEEYFYSGGWIAGNPAFLPSREYLYRSLLYAPGVVFHDPLASWFFPFRDRLADLPGLRTRSGGTVHGSEPSLLKADGFYKHHDDLERNKARVTQALEVLGTLRPLIKDGIAVPISHLQIVLEHEDGILSAVRNDVRNEDLRTLIESFENDPPPRADQVRGLGVVPRDLRTSDARRAIVQDPSYFLGKTLAIASATGARYVPPATADAALHLFKLREAGAALPER